MKSRAFTIVELLIVIVIIGILAAITIIAYNGIQSRARASAASAALNQAQKKILIAMNDGTLSSYPADQAAFDALGLSTTNVSYQYSLTNSGSGYCITATVGTTSYKVTNDSQPTGGGCAGHGQGGVGAVTNLMTNPSLESNANNWNGWAGTNGTYSYSRQTSGGYNGTAFHRATWSVAGSGGGINFTFPAVAGKTYVTSMWVRPSKAMSGWCNWQNGGTSATNFSIPANTWTRVVCTGTVPAGQTSVQFNIYGYNAVAGDMLDGDAGMVVEGTQNYTYADGNTQDWVWNGTVNNSTSTGPPG